MTRCFPYALRHDPWAGR